MRSHVERNLVRIISVLLDKFFHLSQTVMEIRSHTKQCRCQISTDSCLFHCFQYLFLSEIMVCKNCYTIVDHLGDSHKCSDINIIICHLALIRPDHLIEPGICSYILCNSLKDIHSCMCMQIRQTRTYKVFAAVNVLICSYGMVIFTLCYNLEDFSIFNIYILFQSAFCFFIQNSCTLQ